MIYWVGQRVCLDFYVPSDGNTQMNFMVNPVLYAYIFIHKYIYMCMKSSKENFCSAFKWLKGKRDGIMWISKVLIISILFSSCFNFQSNHER